MLLKSFEKSKCFSHSFSSQIIIKVLICYLPWFKEKKKEWGGMSSYLSSQAFMASLTLMRGPKVHSVAKSHRICPRHPFYYSWERLSLSDIHTGHSFISFPNEAASSTRASGWVHPSTGYGARHVGGNSGNIYGRKRENKTNTALVGFLLLLGKTLITE